MRLMVREHRVRLGWTQEELAEKAGISRSYLAQIEANTKSIGVRLQQQLAAALGVSPNDLIDWNAAPDDPIEAMATIMRSLPPDQQQKLLRMARSFADGM